MENLSLFGQLNAHNNIQLGWNDQAKIIQAKIRADNGSVILEDFQHYLFRISQKFWKKASVLQVYNSRIIAEKNISIRCDQCHFNPQKNFPQSIIEAGSTLKILGKELHIAAHLKAVTFAKVQWLNQCFLVGTLEITQGDIELSALEIENSEMVLSPHSKIMAPHGSIKVNIPRLKGSTSIIKKAIFEANNGVFLSNPSFTFEGALEIKSPVSSILNWSTHLAFNGQLLTQWEFIVSKKTNEEFLISSYFPDLQEGKSDSVSSHAYFGEESSIIGEKNLYVVSDSIQSVGKETQSARFFSKESIYFTAHTIFHEGKIKADDTIEIIFEKQFNQVGEIKAKKALTIFPPKKLDDSKKEEITNLRFKPGSLTISSGKMHLEASQIIIEKNSISLPKLFSKKELIAISETFHNEGEIESEDCVTFLFTKQFFQAERIQSNHQLSIKSQNSISGEAIKAPSEIIFSDKSITSSKNGIQLCADKIQISEKLNSSSSAPIAKAQVKTNAPIKIDANHLINFGKIEFAQCAKFFISRKFEQYGNLITPIFGKLIVESEQIISDGLINITQFKCSGKNIIFSEHSEIIAKAVTFISKNDLIFEGNWKISDCLKIDASHCWISDLIIMEVQTLEAICRKMFTIEASCVWKSKNKEESLPSKITIGCLISVNAINVELFGNLYCGGSIQFKVQDSFNLHAHLGAHHSITIEDFSKNSKKLKMTLFQESELKALENISLNLKSLEVLGKIISSEQVKIEGFDVVLKKDSIFQGDEVTIFAKKFLELLSNDIYVYKQLHIFTESLFSEGTLHCCANVCFGVKVWERGYLSINRLLSDSAKINFYLEAFQDAEAYLSAGRKLFLEAYTNAEASVSPERKLLHLGCENSENVIISINSSLNINQAIPQHCSDNGKEGSIRFTTADGHSDALLSFLIEESDKEKEMRYRAEYAVWPFFSPRKSQSRRINKHDSLEVRASFQGVRWPYVLPIDQVEHNISDPQLGVTPSDSYDVLKLKQYTAFDQRIQLTFLENIKFAETNLAMRLEEKTHQINQVAKPAASSSVISVLIPQLTISEQESLECDLSMLNAPNELNKVSALPIHIISLNWQKILEVYPELTEELWTLNQFFKLLFFIYEYSRGLKNY